MKLPSRRIIILLIVSLTALFGYQIYWLSGLYKSRYQSDESLINVSLQMADFAEIMERVNALRSEGDLHGSVSVSTGWSKAEKQTNVRTDSVVVDKDGTRTIKVTTVKTEKSEGSLSASASSYAVNSIDEMSSAYQIGLHQGIDTGQHSHRTACLLRCQCATPLVDALRNGHLGGHIHAGICTIFTCKRL